MAVHHPHPHDDAHPHDHEQDSGPVAFSDPAHESLSNALRSGFNLLRVAMIVLLVAYVASGWFQVNPGEQGVIVRFGSLRENTGGDRVEESPYVFGPGTHPSFPDPIDEKIRVSGNIARLNIETFMFTRQDNDRGKPLAEIVPSRERLNPASEGTMITGDRALCHGYWTLEYRIENAEKFVRSIGDSLEAAGPLLRCIAESAIIQTVAGLTVETVLRTEAEAQSAAFVAAVQRRINDELTRLGAGITVNKVTADTIEPGAVRDAFLRVTRAKSDREAAITRAIEERTRILSEVAGSEAKYSSLLAAIEQYGAAQTAGADEERLDALRDEIDGQLQAADGTVAVRLRDAGTTATSTREKISGEYDRFVSYRNAYRRQPKLTITRLWTEMREAILKSKRNEVFYIPDTDEIEIITNRDPAKALEADRERFRARAGG